MACGSWHVACIVTPRNNQKNPCAEPNQLTCRPTTEVKQTSQEISRVSSYIDLNSNAAVDNEENVNGVKKASITDDICVEKQPDIASRCWDFSATQSSPSSPHEDRQTIDDMCRAHDTKEEYQESDEAKCNLREERDLKLSFCEEDHSCKFDDASSADSSCIFISAKSSHTADSVNDQIFEDNPLLVKEKLDSEAVNKKTELRHSPLEMSVLQEYRTIGSKCSGPSKVQNSEYNAKTTAASRSETKKRDQAGSERVLDAKSMESETAKKVVLLGEQNEDSVLNEETPISSVSRYFNHEGNSTPFKTKRIADSIWNQSQTIPISSVSHPVKQEDSHHGGSMSSITLGFQSDKQEIAAVSSVKPLEKTIHRFTNKHEGNHSSGNLKRSKKPPRSFRRRVSSNAEQLVCNFITISSNFVTLENRIFAGATRD